MKCPSCGGAKLVRGTRAMPYTYKGKSTLIPKVTGDFCPACGEVVLDEKKSAHVSLAMRDFIREINASMVDPAFIAGVRKKLGLDQRDAAKLFGGGVNGFSRYETGKARPPLALVQLFRVLDRHPGLLAEVRP